MTQTTDNKIENIKNEIKINYIIRILRIKQIKGSLFGINVTRSEIKLFYRRYDSAHIIYSYTCYGMQLRIDRTYIDGE